MKRLITILTAVIIAMVLIGGCGTPKTVENGRYKAELTMEGGTGKAYIESPVLIEVIDGSAAVTLVWSSKNYDYMIVEGKKYLNENEGEASTFTITLDSVEQLKDSLQVIGDTTAMSTPHEIEYTLSFGDLEKYE